MQTIALIAAIVLPLWNIPLIVRIIRRKSSDDISISWVCGVWVCLLLMAPQAFSSVDIVWKVFNAANVLLFSCVVFVVFFYRFKRLKQGGNMKKSVLLLCVLVLLSGCAKYSKLCNALYCNTDITGMSARQLLEEYGEPTFKEKNKPNEIWTYEIAPLWRYGAKGKIVAVFEENVVTSAHYIPPQSKSRTIE
jgi:uncharacterized protein with PQ loop repeat